MFLVKLNYIFNNTFILHIYFNFHLIAVSVFFFFFEAYVLPFFYFKSDPDITYIFFTWVLRQISNLILKSPVWESIKAPFSAQIFSY